jgi:hypothetical protein
VINHLTLSEIPDYEEILSPYIIDVMTSPQNSRDSRNNNIGETKVTTGKLIYTTVNSLKEP